MKEILFRGQRVDNGEWVYGNLINWNPKLNPRIVWCEYCEIDEYIETNYEIKKESVSQYIGHKDKNNVKIFENDRVLYDGVLGNVFYSDDLAMFMVRFDYTNSIYSFDSLDRDVEVV